MKILVGICGIGNGHLNRQISVIQYLLESKHEVVVATTNNNVEYFKNIFSNVKIVNINIPWITCNLKGIDFKDSLNKYIQNNAIDLSDLKYETNTYHLFGGSVLFKRNSLNSLQYATKGVSQQILAQIFSGQSTYSPDTLHMEKLIEEGLSWLQISFKNQRYLPLGNRFTLGTHLEGYYSSRNLAQNYTATMLQAGTFAPTPSMLFTYNTAFRANQYLAAGIKPIYQINPYIQVRLEAYAFAPIYPILCDETGNAYYGKAFSTLEHIEELSIVGRFSTFVISAYLNHNSHTSQDFNVGISLGWYVRNNRFIEQ